MRSSVQNPTAVFSQGLGGLWGSPPEWKEKMMSDTRKITLRTRVRLAQLEFAAMRWESATMIALTIIATPATYLFAGILLLPDEIWIAVLLFGLVAEGTLILSSMSDPEAGTNFVSAMLERQFNVTGIGDETIRGHVARAFEYRARMEGILGGKGRALRSTMSETVAGVDNWLTGIGRLAKRLDRFGEEANFQSADKFQLRERTDDLTKRMREAADKQVRRQLRETIAGRKHQLRMIEELENLMERGELRLEHAVGALGTIYTQVTIFAARGMDEGDAARLTSEISNEIDQVDAVLAAMDRVYEPDKSANADEEECQDEVKHIESRKNPTSPAKANSGNEAI